MIDDTIDTARRNCRFSQQLADIVLQQDRALVDTKATAESRRLHNLASQVLGEAHKLKGFSRLSMSKHGILYGTVDVQHEVEDMVIAHFAERFPRFVIVIESKRGVFISGKPIGKITVVNSKMKDVIEKLEKSLPVDELLSDLEDFDSSSWEAYYNSQYIPARRNIKLFLKNVPKKFHQLKGFDEAYSYKRSKKLSDYL